MVLFLFFDVFNIYGLEMEYVLLICIGRFVMFGWRVLGFVVCLLNGLCMFILLSFIECNEILDNRNEIFFKVVV